MFPLEIIQAYEDPEIGVTSVTKFANNIKYKDVKGFRRILEMSNVFAQSIFTHCSIYYLLVVVQMMVTRNILFSTRKKRILLRNCNFCPT